MLFWRSFRLSHKLIIAFLVLGLTPLLIVGGVAQRTASDALTKNAGQRVEEVAFTASDKLDRNLFERYGDVQAFALSDPAQAMDSARITAWMNKMMTAYAPNYTLMVVADPKGEVIAVNTVNARNVPIDPTTRPLLKRSVSGEPWFVEATSGRVNAGRSFVEDLHHDPLVAAVYGTDNGLDLAMGFTAPIRDASGKIIGVWTNRFNWDVATKILQQSEEHAKRNGAKSMQLGIASVDGTALALPNPQGVLTDSLAEHQGFKKTPDSAVGYTEGRSLVGGKGAYEGWARSAGFSSYVGKGWVVLASQEKGEALAQANGLGRTIVMLGVIAGLLIVAVAWGVSRTISAPLVALRNAADRVSRGEDDNIDITVNSRDEIADLADAFRRMVASVRFLRRRGRRSMEDDDDDGFGATAAS